MIKTTLFLPTATAQFTKLDRPDTSYSPEGEFIAMVSFDTVGQKELNSILDPVITSAIASLTAQGEKVTKSSLNVPLKTNDDGTVTLKAKTKAVATNRETGQQFTNTVRVLDKNGSELETIPMIGKGSKLQLEVDAVPYSIKKKTGLSFRLKTVKILDLVTVESKTTTANVSGVPF